MPGPLSGPGYYAVQLFENAIKQSDFKDRLELIGYVQPSSMKHFSDDARAFLRCCPELKGRIPRVLYEQLVLPFVAMYNRVDLLFSPGFVSPLWGAPHLVATICDMYYRVIPEALDPRQLKYWATMIPLTARVCSRIITISNHSKMDIERFLPAARGKTTSIPLASRLSVAPSGSYGHATVPEFVLMVANLTHNKNPQIVVQAIAALNKIGRKVLFLHAGSDPYNLLRDSVIAHDADGLVASLGKISEERLADLYRTCLAVVTPSTYEGFGMPAAEAQAMGAILISSDRAALPEVGGDAALYFDPSRADQLASHISDVMGLSPEGRIDMKRRSLESAARLSWHRTARETVAVFDELLSASRS